jgi:hypothetical protein
MLLDTLTRMEGGKDATVAFTVYLSSLHTKPIKKIMLE